MKKRKILYLFIILFLNTVLSSGCWNYREIDKLAIVSGIAIDKEKGDSRYALTVEIATPSPSEKGGGVTTSEIYETRAKTMFEGVRNMIVETGKKAYWSHSKVIIISRQIAEEEGVAPVLDFFYRDSETRRDVLVLISNAPTAGELLKEEHDKATLLSYKIDTAVRSQKSISRFPLTELRDVVENFRTEESATLVPVINRNRYREKNKNIPQVFGSAVLKRDKVVGYLNGDETKYALWVKGKLKGGLFIVRDILNQEDDISFEMYGNRTKKKADYSDNQLKMKVSVQTDVGIGESTGTIDFSDEKNFKSIKSDAEKKLKTSLNEVVEKLQKDYKADIFDFQKTVEIQQNKVWKKNKSNWNEQFADMPVEIDVNLIIKGTALTSKPIKSGEQ